MDETRILDALDRHEQADEMRMKKIEALLAKIEEHLCNLDTLNERREKHRLTVQRSRQKNRGVTSHENVTSQKEKEKGKEKFPPHPLIEKREDQEKADADDALRARTEARGEELRDGDSAVPPTAEELEAWCKDSATNFEWAKAKLDWLNDNNFSDSSGRPIKNWRTYLRKAYENASAKKGKNESRQNTSTGAYANLTDEMRTFFDAFWEAYPKRRRTEKDKCAATFSRILTNSGDPSTMSKKIMDGLAGWRESYDWKKQDGEYVMQPYRFLYNKNWETIPLKGQPCERKRQVSATANVKLDEELSW